MIGIIVQLAISWLLIWIFEKKDLGVLGLRPTQKRLADFFLFLIITALCCASGFFMRMNFGERWILNPVLTWKLVAEGAWWNIKSVLFEELIFRGVLLYILIKRSGVLKGIVISAVAFGIYHWFSFELFGNTSGMITTFLITGTMGLVYAYGYAKSFSIYIPSAIHLGWNFTQGFVFSQGPVGNGIFVATKPEKVVNVSYLTYFIVIFLPLIAAMVINYLVIKKRAIPS